MTAWMERTNVSDLHIELTNITHDLGQVRALVQEVMNSGAAFLPTPEIRQLNQAITRLTKVEVSLIRITTPQEARA